METLGFKKVSTDASFTDFEAVLVVPAWEIQGEDYTDINDVNRKVVDVVHKKWEIKFALLTETLMDFLIDMSKEEAPQMYYDATTYNIQIRELKVERIGSAITVVKAEAE